jgi:hypothetical protein
MKGEALVSAMKTVCPGRGALLPGGILAILLLLPATSARANLGGDASSIDADASALLAKTSASAPQELNQSSSYNVKSFVTGDGTSIREYFAPSGPVFGVAWQGRRPADLSVLLGPYYSEYVEASRNKGEVGLHHAVIQGPHSIVILSGRMGNLMGHAYVPSLAPSGIDAKSVVK